MKYDNDAPKTFSLVKMLSLCQKAQFLMMLCLNFQSTFPVCMKFSQQLSEELGTSMQL